MSLLGLKFFFCFYFHNHLPSGDHNQLASKWEYMELKGKKTTFGVKEENIELFVFITLYYNKKKLITLY